MQSRYISFRNYLGPFPSDQFRCLLFIYIYIQASQSTGPYFIWKGTKKRRLRRVWCHERTTYIIYHKKLLQSHSDDFFFQKFNQNFSYVSHEICSFQSGTRPIVPINAGRYSRVTDRVRSAPSEVSWQPNRSFLRNFWEEKDVFVTIGVSSPFSVVTWCDHRAPAVKLESMHVRTPWQERDVGSAEI